MANRLSKDDFYNILETYGNDFDLEDVGNYVEEITGKRNLRLAKQYYQDALTIIQDDIVNQLRRVLRGNEIISIIKRIMLNDLSITDKKTVLEPILDELRTYLRKF